MAKKKIVLDDVELGQENEDPKNLEEVVVTQAPIVVVDEDKELYQFNGKGIGVYFDEKLKRYAVVSLDLCPETETAVITNTKVVGVSKMSAILTADVDLKKILEKKLK